MFICLVNSVERAQMDHLLTALKAFAEPTRLRIVALCSQGDLTVSELVQILSQSQPRVSRHLKLLCDAGILHRLREGSWVFHRLSQEGANHALVEKLVGLIPLSDETILRDQERLQEVKFERADKAAHYFSVNAPRWEEIRALHADDSLVEKAVLDLLAPMQDHDFLDVGTGTGRLLEVMSPHIHQGWGIDLSLDMLSFARAKLEESSASNCAVRQGDMYQIPFPQESFDLVGIHQVLHYSDEPARAIQEAARVLKVSGRMVIVDFAPHEEESLRTQHQHRRLGFARQEVIRLCEDSALEVSAFRAIAGTPLTVNIWLAEKRS